MDDRLIGEVIGTVERADITKGGLPYARVTVQRLGAQYPDRVTVWGLDAAAGDRVHVSGVLSWRKRDIDGKVYVDVSLNDVRVLAHEPVGMSEQAPADPWTAAPIPPVDVWSAPPADDGVPF